MLKIRRPLGRLIFNMGIAIPGKTVFLIETAPRVSSFTASIVSSVTLYLICIDDLMDTGHLRWWSNTTWWYITKYCQTSNISHTKSQNLDDSHLIIGTDIERPLFCVFSNHISSFNIDSEPQMKVENWCSEFCASACIAHGWVQWCRWYSTVPYQIPWENIPHHWPSVQGNCSLCGFYASSGSVI